MDTVEALNVLALLGLGVAFIISRYHRRLLGGLLGLVFTVLLLIVGIVVYSKGGAMALRGNLEIPQWLFILVVVGAFIAYGIDFLVGLKQKLGTIQQDQTIQVALRSNTAPGAVFKQLVDQMDQDEASVGKVASTVISGESYRDTVAQLCNTQKLSIGDAVLRYRQAIDLLRELRRRIMSQYAAADRQLNDQDLPSHQFNAVLVRDKITLGGAKFGPGEMIVSYGNHLVTDVDRLSRLADRTANDQKVPVHVLYFDPNAGEMVTRKTNMQGGSLGGGIQTMVGNAAELAPSSVPSRPSVQAKVYRAMSGQDLPPEVRATMVINTPARLSLAMGILSILFAVGCVAFITGPLGIAFGVMGAKKAWELNGVGAGTARAGKICSIIGIIISALVLILFLVHVSSQD